MFKLIISVGIFLIAMLLSCFFIGVSIAMSLQMTFIMTIFHILILFINNIFQKNKLPITNR